MVVKIAFSHDIGSDESGRCDVVFKFVCGLAFQSLTNDTPLTLPLSSTTFDELKPATLTPRCWLTHFF